jgi:hypothetical protein
MSSPQLPSERRFGALFVVVFALAAGYGAYNGWSHGLLLGLAIASVGFGVATLIRPKMLRPLNLAWFKLGVLMGKIVSPIVLGIIFYLLITPVGLVGRLFGRDELKLKRGAEKSYWIKRDPPGPSGESFKNQY